MENLLILVAVGWVWVATFSVLGSKPEHNTFGAFNTKQECQLALEQRRQDLAQKGKEIAGTCFYTQRKL